MEKKNVLPRSTPDENTGEIFWLNLMYLARVCSVFSIRIKRHTETFNYNNEFNLSRYLIHNNTNAT